MKKQYEKPAVIYSAPLGARAVVCCRSDDSCRTAGGPINS